MQGMLQSVGRLAIMGLVMAAVLVAAIVTGVAATTAIAIGIVLAGVVGLVMVARRPAQTSTADEMAAILAGPAPSPTQAAPGVSTAAVTSVEAMAPPSIRPVDPEANMPRWRRPSLLEARRSDPTRQASTDRQPMRFVDTDSSRLDVRVVRYAVVPLLDRPDELAGIRLADLAAGDEVQVLGATGAFLEVHCPTGQTGYIHRTTVRLRGVESLNPAFAPVPQDADDALTALLTARGLI
jgi:hypothetical protein